MFQKRCKDTANRENDSLYPFKKGFNNGELSVFKPILDRILTFGDTIS